MTALNLLRLLVMSVVLALALTLLFCVRAAMHSYKEVMYDFASWPRSAALDHPEAAGIANLSSAEFRVDGRVIRGWYVPSRNRAAVIVTHGTNSDRTKMLPEARLLSQAGFGVLIFDWPGNGASDGEVRWSEGERRALIAAVDWVSERTDVDATRIGSFGFSMGGYMLAQVAAGDLRLRSVVLASAPSSFVDYTHWVHRRWGMLTEHPADWALQRVGMMNETLKPIDLIAAIAPRPLLLLGGSEDPVIPTSMTQALYDRAGEPKSLWIIPGAAHGEYMRVQPLAYQQRLVTFFSDTLLH